jgi:hypothetical protein
VSIDFVGVDAHDLQAVRADVREAVRRIRPDDGDLIPRRLDLLVPATMSARPETSRATEPSRAGSHGVVSGIG